MTRVSRWLLLPLFLGWLAVVMVSVFGTMAADIPHFLGVPLWIPSAGYLLAVLAIVS